MQALSHTIYSTCSMPTLGATTGPQQRELPSRQEFMSCTQDKTTE